MFGVWEPLLEPLEIDQTEDFRPWNLGIKVFFLKLFIYLFIFIFYGCVGSSFLCEGFL